MDPTSQKHACGLPTRSPALPHVSAFTWPDRAGGRTTPDHRAVCGLFRLEQILPERAEDRQSAGAASGKVNRAIVYYPEHPADKGFMGMSSGTEIVIAGAVRTPLGKFGGSLTSLSAPMLGAVAAR